MLKGHKAWGSAWKSFPVPGWTVTNYPHLKILHVPRTSYKENSSLHGTITNNRPAQSLSPVLASFGSDPLSFQAFGPGNTPPRRRHSPIARFPWHNPVQRFLDTCPKPLTGFDLVSGSPLRHGGVARVQVVPGELNCFILTLKCATSLPKVASARCVRDRELDTLMMLHHLARLSWARFASVSRTMFHAKITQDSPERGRRGFAGVAGIGSRDS